MAQRLLRNNPLLLLRNARASGRFSSYSRAVLSVLKSMRKEAVADVRAGRKPSFNLRKYTNQLSKMRRPLILDMISEGYALAAEDVKYVLSYPIKSRGKRKPVLRGKATISTKPKPMDFILREDLQDIEKYLLSTSAVEITQTAKIINNVFRRISENETTVNKIAAALNDELENMTINRANMLARTGTIWSYNEGAKIRYERDGITVVEWCTTEDDSTCPFCLALDGVRVKTGDNFLPKNGNFKVGKQSLKIRFDITHPPAHPNALIAGTKIYTTHGQKNIENLKVGDEVLTHRGRFRAIYQMWKKKNDYDYLIVLKTKNKVLKLTREHPVLTNRGWLRADEITDKDELCINNGYTDWGPLNPPKDFVCEKEWIQKMVMARPGFDFLINKDENKIGRIYCLTTKESYKKDVFNIAVNEDESYIANGIVVHNCRCCVVPVVGGA